MFAVASIILAKIARPQEEERKEKAKEERKAKEKAKAKDIRRTFTEEKVKACRHLMGGVGIKEENIRLNHNHHHHHGCSNRPVSAAWAIGATWDNGAGSNHKRRRHGVHKIKVLQSPGKCLHSVLRRKFLDKKR